MTGKKRRQSNETLDASFTGIKSVPRAQLYKNGAFSFGAGETLMAFDGALQNNKINVSGNQVTFTEAGIYQASGSFRSTVDVWRKWYTKTSSGTLVGESAWGGSSPNYPNPETWLFAVASPGTYTFGYFNGGTTDSITVPAPSGSPPGSLVMTLCITIHKLGDI